MDLYILNRQEKIVGVLSNEGHNNFLSSAVMKESLREMDTLTLEVSSLGIEVSEVKEENYVLFQDITGTWKNFIIREVNEIHGTDAMKQVYAEDSSQELIDYLFFEELKGQKLSPSSLLGIILQGTRWEVGEVDKISPVTFPEETRKKTVLECIHLIVETFNLQLRFRIEVAGNKIIGRYVDIKKHIGANYGKRFEYSKDIEKIERKVMSTRLKTAIIPFGAVPEEEEKEESKLKDNIQNIEENQEEKPNKPPIDITGVQWTKPKNPLNKPFGQNYLEIPEATAQWGYMDKEGKMKPRFLLYENTECKTPEELIQKAYEVLRDISKPVTNYKLEVIDLFALTKDTELSFETVRLGDIVSVIDHEFTPAIQIKTSIIEREVDLLLPENTKIELGSFIRNLVDSESSQQIQDMINASLSTGLEDIEAKVVDVSNTFEDFKKNYTSNELNLNWIKNSDFSNGLKYYDSWNDSDFRLEAVNEIPYFDNCGRLSKGNFTQEIEGAEKLKGNNVTFSAFVWGAGHLSLEITYINKEGHLIQDVLNSKQIPDHKGWNRYSMTVAITQQHVRKILVSFVPESDSYVTGLQLNLGAVPSKYSKNPSDKYGKGVYDQIRAVSDAEFKNGLGYVYLEEEDGLWVYDKPSNNQPTKMTALKGGMLGIGNWNPQTRQWDIRTFIDGNMVNASCINTGKLNADLIKTGRISSLDGSVQINMENGRFSFGVGGSGNTAQLTNDEFKIHYSDGSYTQMNKDGFRWWKAGNSRAYHCLATTIEFTASGDPNNDITVTLPTEFRGKDFTAQAVLSDTYTDSWDWGQPWVVQRMVVLVSGINKENGTVTIKGYRTDKNYQTGAYRRCAIRGVLIVIA
ncbi:TPA: phage tail protein [Clostridium perfringens]|nr:phage tail protein [Clostridium perfringens]